MRLSDVMDDVAARLRSIPEFVEVAAYPKGSVTAPGATVEYPEEYDPNASYQRGTARITLPVRVWVGKPHERTARDHLSAFVDGEGGSSVVACLQSGTYTAFDSLAVNRIEIGQAPLADIEHLVAIFHVDIMGSGR